jgi:hypothetical protein
LQAVGFTRQEISVDGNTETFLVFTTEKPIRLDRLLHFNI